MPSDASAWRLLLSSKVGKAIIRPVYQVYEHRLIGEIRCHPIPRHIGIILDGNRRHALRHGISNAAAIYTIGAAKLDDFLEWCADLSVDAVTLWVFSTDNWHRPTDQVCGILAAVEAKLRMLIDHPSIHSRRVRVRAIGKLELLPSSLYEAIRAASDATARYEGITLTLAVAYGGRDEIVDAVRGLLAEFARRGLSVAEANREISRESIARHLYTAGLPDPELIIRTSGEVRLSGFLLWQSAHSEFYFCDVPWPAFRKIDFLRAIRSHQLRNRRFGR